MLYCSWGALTSLSPLLLSWGPLYAPLEDSWPVSAADAVTEASVLCSIHPSSHWWVSQGYSLLLHCKITHQSLLMLLVESVLHSGLPKRWLLLFSPLFSWPTSMVLLHYTWFRQRTETLNRKIKNFLWMQIQLGPNIYFCLKQGLQGEKSTMQIGVGEGV